MYSEICGICGYYASLFLLLQEDGMDASRNMIRTLWVIYYVFLWMKMICVQHDLLLCLAHMSHSIHLTRPKPSDSRIFMYVCDLLKNIVFDYEIVKMARYVMSKKWWWCHLVTGDREDMTRGRGLIQIILIQKKDVCLECSNHIFGWSFVITVITSFCTSQWCHKYLVPSSVTCEIACNNVP